MLRSTFLMAAILAIGSAAFGQGDVSAKIHPLPKPAKDAGVYHVATGKWTRGATANIGTDVLYDNTCTIGFFIGLSPGETLVDSGRIPSTSSPTNFVSLTGFTDQPVMIDGFQIAYCTFVQGTTSITMSWYNAYSPCSDASVLMPDAALSISGLPGDITGSGSCWIVTIDLMGTGTGTGFTFQLTPDQDGAWNGSASSDNFGWAFLETSTSTLGNGGPLLGGDPINLFPNDPCGVYGEGTAWASTPNSGLPGTGIGSDDVFETDQGGAMAGCWFFGGYFSGNPYASFYHQLRGDAQGQPTEPGTAYCNCDVGHQPPAPCGNFNDGSLGIAGCANTNNNGGGTLRAVGSVSTSIDFLARNCAPNRPGLFFQADNAINGGNGVVFGDGLRCAGNNVVRLGVRFTDANGDTSLVGVPPQPPGVTKRYQYWYRNDNVSPCGAGFNLTNAYEITW